MARIPDADKKDVFAILDIRGSDREKHFLCVSLASRPNASVRDHSSWATYRAGQSGLNRAQVVKMT